MLPLRLHELLRFLLAECSEDTFSFEVLVRIINQLLPDHKISTFLDALFELLVLYLLEQGLASVLFDSFYVNGL
mgnify:CR=1 FL=1